ncbi:molecular chaperone [Providencia vermicola]|uniref:fimbrial biogenesis chaperone n=1 Tax=Providencia vermicola TaxID=333965 RepID=UPI003523669B
MSRISYLSRLYRYIRLFLITGYFVFCTCAYTANIDERSGITIQSTRVIYSGSETKGITFSVANDSVSPYLLQSRITPWAQDLQTDYFEDETKVVPFIVTPPLKRLESRESLALLIRLTQHSLPTDRESVFAFHIKAIPSQPSNENQQGISLPVISNEKTNITVALKNTLKLFYRPEELPPYDAQKIAESLQFKRQNEQLVVTNPTAFYVTFDVLTIDGKNIKDDDLFFMTPPLSQQTYPIPNGTTRGDISFQLLNDYGVKTNPVIRTLNNKNHNDE